MWKRGTFSKDFLFIFFLQNLLGIVFTDRQKKKKKNIDIKF